MVKRKPEDPKTLVCNGFTYDPLGHLQDQYALLQALLNPAVLRELAQALGTWAVATSELEPLTCENRYWMILILISIFVGLFWCVQLAYHFHENSHQQYATVYSQTPEARYGLYVVKTLLKRPEVDQQALAEIPAVEP